MCLLNGQCAVDAEAALAKANFTPVVFSEEEKAVELTDMVRDDTLRILDSKKPELDWEHQADKSPIIVIGLQNEHSRASR